MEVTVIKGQGRLELHFGWCANEGDLPIWLRRSFNPRLRQHLSDNLGKPVDTRMWLAWSPLWEAVRLGAQ
jgi:hypothetical protein